MSSTTTTSASKKDQDPKMCESINRDLQDPYFTTQQHKRIYIQNAPELIPISNREEIIHVRGLRGPLIDIHKMLISESKVSSLKGLPSMPKEYSPDVHGTGIPVLDNLTAEKLLNARKKLVKEYGFGNKKEYIFEHRYLIKDSKGSFATIVENIDSKVQRFLKIEASEKQKPGIPSLNRDVKFLLNATKTKRMDHFLKFIEKFSFPGRFNAYVFELGGLPLSDIRTKLLNGELFSRGCFARICLLSLRAIHDVHYNFFIHRDIRPSNFLTSYGTGKKGLLYLINFSISYDFSDDSLYSNKVVSTIQSRRPPKLPWINCCYQSRDYHEGRLVSRHNDIESWLYTMMFFYDSKCLPWDSVKTERELLTYKELLNSGYYDGEFKDFDKFLHVMLKHLNQHLNSAAIDFPFYFSVLKLMCKEWNVSWPMIIFDWDRPLKDFSTLPKLTPVIKKKATIFEKNEMIIPKHVSSTSSAPSFTKRKDFSSTTTSSATAVSPAVMTAIARSPINNNNNVKSKQTQEFFTQNTEDTITSKMKKDDKTSENEILEEKTARSDKFFNEDGSSGSGGGGKETDDENDEKKS